MSAGQWLNAGAIEVLALLSGPAIFSFAALPPFPCRIEHDFDTALSVAWANEEWGDFRERQWAEVLAHLYERDNYAALHRRLTDAFEEREKAFRKRFRFIHTPGLTPTYRRNRYWECVGAILSDIGLCFRARFLDATSEFTEGLFAIYASGCWPCGWEGRYPVGQFIIYQGDPDPLKRALPIGADVP